MPASVAATGWCFMKSSTNSSQSAVNVRIVSIMRRGPGGPGRGAHRRDGPGARERGDPVILSAFVAPGLIGSLATPVAGGERLARDPADCCGSLAQRVRDG